METLYTELAEVYQIMYQTFIPYDAEFEYYHHILRRYGVRDVLELGCGTGNLAQRFVARGYRFEGLDISAEMLDIARRQLPEQRFRLADMCNFEADGQADAALCVGRSASYVLHNEGFFGMLRSVHRALRDGGSFVFDVIDAARFLPGIRPDEVIRHEACHGSTRYTRDSIFRVNAREGWTWDWTATYFREEADGSRVQLSHDTSTLRTFTRDEVTTFLKLSGFEVVACYDRLTYAFDTWVFVAKRVG